LCLLKNRDVRQFLTEKKRRKRYERDKGMGVKGEILSNFFVEFHQEFSQIFLCFFVRLPSSGA
jgi:hypothetical protein